MAHLLNTPFIQSSPSLRRHSSRLPPPSLTTTTKKNH
ncbi:hypothetical protein CsSME_00015564 [Camellia sinensis var. sinensis]